jgi:hypothetical protein
VDVDTASYSTASYSKVLVEQVGRARDLEKASRR